ncbi:replication initiation negative regulator SeqA [Oceanisphaera pacifica]|uniref:Negative modulator of initiation of replication n=1 Tax=Oceanisphaera pacifica TaxID=2818389 RepID=A0ABS3NEW4_9GAMM|nr:replication initiation negative regulator SeqA [Oceanisphaera pacifica]MBO1519085.1 replication initiation negative regulator SeqA [Oceanisphaera pacifica]
MKSIEIDEDLYRYIASNTRHIGESASDILRRLLQLESVEAQAKEPAANVAKTAAPEVAVGQRVQEMLKSNVLVEQESAIDRFMHILSVLYQDNPSAFAQASDIKGRKRIYFADDEAALLASGNTTKPKAIAGSPYWVITNTNTGRKRNIVAQLMAAMGYSHSLIERVCHSI